MYVLCVCFLIYVWWEEIYINILYTNHFGAMVDFEGA